MHRCVLGLGLLAFVIGAAPLDARALAITGLTLQNDSTPDFVVNGAQATEGRTDLSLLAQTARTVDTRFALVAAADKDAFGAPRVLTADVSALYTLSFSVDAAPAEAWKLVIDSSRVFAITMVDDNPFSGAERRATVSVGALTATLAGTSLASGSLDLAGTSDDSAFDRNLAFSQLASAETVFGFGPASVSLTFAFDASATSYGTSTITDNPGNEAALRMGLASTLTTNSTFTAGDYPGVGGRDAAADGHFVSIALVPEPATGALLALGLAGLAARRRRA